MSDLLDHLDKDARGKARKASQPSWTSPMLATLTHEPFSDREWVYERKLDGERCLLFVKGGEARLMSRNRKNLNDTYPELHEAAEAMSAGAFVADGEIVAFDGAVTSFARLQTRIGITDRCEARASTVKVYLYLFDLLHEDGYDLTRVPQRDRKTLLQHLFEFREPFRYTPHRNTSGLTYFREACDKGWEGLIAKQAASTYQHGRSKQWLKFKCVNRQEFVVVGFTEPQGSRVGFGALELGYFEDGDLVHAGRVGAGFDDSTLQSLREKLNALERAQPTPDRMDRSADRNGVHWVNPELVAEVAFTEWTEGGRLRHPRYLGLRDDKEPQEVNREQA